MKVLAFAASLRHNSSNRKMIAIAADVLRERGCEVDLADFKEFNAAPYNGDDEVANGLPPEAEEMARRIEAADAVVISTPEYNGSIPGTLKNCVDWVSRLRPTPLNGRSVLLMCASASLIGGHRGLWACRIPFEMLGSFVHPAMLGLPKAETTFDEDGSFIDEKNQQRMEKLIDGFLDAAGKLQSGG